jgi:hypothetical protein
MRCFLVAAVVAVVTVVAAEAGAQDDPRKVQAAPFFEEGRKLAEKGQNAESLERFKKAYAIYPSPNTQFNIARQEQLLGQRLAALRDYREALRNPILLPQVAEMARGYVGELERVLGRVKIVGPEGTRVTVAGTDYTLPLADAVDVEPGTIAMQGTRGDERFTATAEAKAGTTVTVTIGQKATSPIIDDHPPPEIPGPSNATRNIVAGSLVAGSLVAIGIVGIGVGVGFTVAANNSSNDLARAKAATGGDSSQTCATAHTPDCDARSSAADSLARDTNIARVMYVVGGAAVVGGVVAFLVWPSAKSSSPTSGTAHVAPWISAGSLGVSYGREF